MRIILFITISFLLNTVQAQFNDSTHYYTNYTSTGTINKTRDASSYILSNALKFSVKKKSAVVNSSSSWLYGYQQHTLTNNDFSSSLDFNLYKTWPHFYYWGLGHFDKSYSLKINNRWQGGLGGAYNIADKPNTSINISEGILYESSDIKLNDSTNAVYKTFRNSLRIRYRLVIRNIIILDGLNLFQNSLSYKSDYIINSTNSLSLKLRKWLSLTTAATYNRIQRTQSENLLITFGLSAEKYF